MAKQPALDSEKLRQLRESMRGELIGREDPQYEEARKVYNGMIDRKPLFIARCVNVADVIIAVNAARNHQLQIAVRGGSHSVAGFGVCDDGLVIDLSLMKGIHMDPNQRTARAEAGCTWADLDHATHAFGLAVPGGLLSSTGIAGLTLGGGIGYLTRKHGLTCDNLLEVDMVTADGRFVKANQHENKDLFWGVRGGGGNFGIVTSFLYQLHPVHTVIGGPVFYPVEKTEEVLRFYRDFIADAPEELSSFFAFQIGPAAPFIPEHLHGVTMCAIITCYSGSLEKGEDAVRPIREFGPPLLDLMETMEYPKLQSMFDALLPHGLQHYWKADFMNDISDEVIAIHAKHGSKVPNVESTMHIYPINGAAHRVGKNDTAFSYRDATFIHNICAMYPDPADTPQRIEWVRDYWSALHPHSAGGAYVNFMMDDETPDRIKATYRDNYDQLLALKNKYDPRNLFQLNQNVKPDISSK